MASLSCMVCIPIKRKFQNLYYFSVSHYMHIKPYVFIYLLCFLMRISCVFIGKINYYHHYITKYNKRHTVKGKALITQFHHCSNSETWKCKRVRTWVFFQIVLTVNTSRIFPLHNISSSPTQPTEYQGKCLDISLKFQHLKIINHFSRYDLLRYPLMRLWYGINNSTAIVDGLFRQHMPIQKCHNDR